MLNHIVIMGRLTKDPELRYTQSQTPVASFTVACERDYQNRDGSRDCDFIDVVAWRKTGEFVQKYFGKGSMIVVYGRLQSRKWQDRDGNKRTSWEVNADGVYFGEGKKDGGETKPVGHTQPYMPPDWGEQMPEDRRGYQPAARPVNVEPPEFEDLGPGYGEGNPFIEDGSQIGMDDGELPF